MSARNEQKNISFLEYILFFFFEKFLGFRKSKQLYNFEKKNNNHLLPLSNLILFLLPLGIRSKHYFATDFVASLSLHINFLLFIHL